MNNEKYLLCRFDQYPVALISELRISGLINPTTTLSY